MNYRFLIVCYIFAISLITPALFAQAVPKGKGNTTELKSKTFQQVFRDLQTKIRYVKLNNGLRLLLVKRGFAPVVACYIKFRSGSYDETPQSFGIAHMLEHMLFKGTRLVGTRDYAREKKYLQLQVRFAQKLDAWRRKEEVAQATNDNEKAKIAQAEIKKWRKRLQILIQQSRAYVVSEEDASIYAAHGARGYNAYTSSDLTNYQVNMPANRLEVWARLESDRMQNAVLRDFYVERNVVREERRMRVENSPRSQLWEKFRMKIYANHPYGHPVIGPMKSIKYLNYEQAMQFYKDYYAPNNTVITLVGNFDIKSAEKLIRRYFGDIAPRALPVTAKLNPPKRRRLDLQLNAGDTPLLYMAWFKPPAPQADDFYMDTLSKILAGSPDTRLYQRLVVKEKLAVSVFAENGIVGDRATNLFLIGVSPAPKASLESIQQVVSEELQRLAKERVDSTELELVAKRQRLKLIHQFENNARLADLLSYFEIVTGDYKNLFRYNSLADTVRPKDIQMSVRNYLSPRYVMTAKLVPQKLVK